MIRIVSLLLVAWLMAPMMSSAQPAVIKGSAGTPVEERRSFTIDGTEVRLAKPDGLTDEELRSFLQAIKRRAIAWRTEPRLSPRRLVLAEVDFGTPFTSTRRSSTASP